MNGRLGRARADAIYASVAVLVLLLSSTALASETRSSSSTSPSTPCGGALIAYLICNGCRKRPIGGWLLFFYIQVFLGGLLSLVFVPTVASDATSPDWESGWLRTMYVVSVVPPLLLLGIVAVLAFVMLFARRPDRMWPFHLAPASAVLLGWMRLALAGWAGASLVGIVIDIAYFPDNVVLSLYSSIPPVAWFFYFQSSARVRMVFGTLNWQYVELERGPVSVGPGRTATPDAPSAWSRFVKGIGRGWTWRWRRATPAASDMTAGAPVAAPSAPPETPPPNEPEIMEHMRRLDDSSGSGRA